jgi:uncharacterized SAM-binding protein YcdF (DUF218 family)
VNLDGLNKEILKQAQILWDYLKLHQTLRKADCVIAMGSHDLRVAEYAAQLVLEGWAPLLVCSGGLGRLTEKVWNEPEARKFAQVTEKAGIPNNQILIEDKSTNTAENLRFSRELLDDKKIDIRSAILVHKPYMERRVIATVSIVWPELDCLVSSPPIEFLNYPNQEIPMDDVIQIMVGDFHRIIVYAEKGFQSPQVMSAFVMDAFVKLVEAGYDQHCVKI